MQLFNYQSYEHVADERRHILYRNILRLETVVVNCSYKYLVNVGQSLCECVENAVND